ncbi:hypothetical protein D0T49_08115 [Paludibacter sp. 221]|uniref:hypothetical protein n=1 Tax=Paludibacter sp. 221 TaxID=2302939 RepID=UPI0013D35AC6|nr:hypothetical protein [Paludibacter sp. 221]NDV47011.1 hypothetical protein [Paludibacter sp. 221]
MMKSENNKILAFKEYYQSLSDNEKNSLRGIITQKCEFSTSTFYYKLKNNNFKKLEINQISIIIDKVKKQ